MTARRAVVTGGGRGIGAAIVDRLASDGYDVVVIDKRPAPGIIECDVSDAAAVDAVAAEIGTVDVLVNNAGMWKHARFEDVTPEDFADVLAVNLIGAFHCTRAFGRPMLDRGGSIVNIASIAAKAAGSGTGSYSASKAGLVALTEQTALAWGPRGVRCNAVGPGLVPTPGTNDTYSDPDVRRSRTRAVPLRRLATPEDIAAAVAFLVSDDASYITGQAIYVDGGLSTALLAQLARPVVDTG
jgi:3-oxoacyl-[acyl-carrier protein] reductase